MVDIETIQDSFQIKIGNFKHQFLSLETPRSPGELNFRHILTFCLLFTFNFFLLIWRKI